MWKRKVGSESKKGCYRNIGNVVEKFIFQNVSVKTVNNILNNWYISKATGIDNISARFLKDGAVAIGLNSANILNLSINNATFLSWSKIVKLKGLFK